MLLWTPVCPCVLVCLGMLKSGWVMIMVHSQYSTNVIQNFIGELPLWWEKGYSCGHQRKCPHFRSLLRQAALTEGHVWNDCVGSELTSSHGTQPPNSPEVLLRSQKSVTVESAEGSPAVPGTGSKSALPGKTQPQL